MDRLWAPWRAAYLHKTDAQEADGCVFCDLPAQGPAFYENNFILSCSSQAFVILNRYPYNAGHLMVIPRKHVGSLMQLSLSENHELSEFLRQSIQIVTAELHAEGINVGMNLGKVAGAGIADHCHFHVVPRWNGDTNFMPVVAETKVMSESLTAVYHKFLPAFQRILSKSFDS